MSHLTGDVMYLRKAEELGVRLSASFDNPRAAAVTTVLLEWNRAV